MELRPDRPASYQDIRDAPAHMVAEIARSDLHLHPRPSPRHAQTASALGDELHSPFSKGRGGPGGWWILDEPELHLGPDILVPDLAGWRRSRLPALPETPYIDLAPDWVCEILSPATRRFDLGAKRAAFGAAGVAHLWMIDPDARTLEAFEREAARWVLAATLEGEDTVRLAPFEAIEFSLAALWAD